MSIITDGNQFHLRTKNTSYIFTKYKDRFLAHNYWGSAMGDDIDCTGLLDQFIFSRANAFHVPLDDENRSFLSDVPMEFSVVGGGDYRTPTLDAVHENGSGVVELEFENYRVLSGKPALEGLPAVYVEDPMEAETLEIILRDRLTGLEATLSYTVLDDYDAITRHVRYRNDGTETIHLRSAQSATVDFYGQDFELLHLHGDWARERSVERVPVGHGVFAVESFRGMSGHMQNPFVALMEKTATEYQGQVYGFSLVYSGNFRGFAEGTSCGTTRVGMGINPFQFDWPLAPGETFTTPEVVMVYSGDGLNRMSQTYHRLYRQRLCRGKFRDAVRPMVINNWEGTTFHIDEDVLLGIAENGAKIGMEMFVVDDGWFGRRDDDNCSLGDWVVDPRKIPNGLDSLAKRVNALGLKFGLWVEPEMISPDSDLYRQRPDWCIHAEGRNRTLCRHQLVLDLSRPEVCDHVIEAISNVLRSANIEYVKWDCNRNFTETANQSQPHRYVLGLYRILETLTERFPNVLFESCSGGGGRFDPGMLYYMPQTWTSDETAAINRLSIQYGTSVVYPAISMTAHVAGVTSVPGATDNPWMRMSALTAMGANFGFEVDLRKLSDDDLARAKEYTEFYKSIRATVQFGEMYRLESPFENGGAKVSWEFVDDGQAVLLAYQTRRLMNGEERRVLLKGLDPRARYRCQGTVYGGEALMKIGVRIPLSADEYAATCLVFEKL